jgi:NTE family protein
VGIPEALSKGIYNFNLISSLTKVLGINDFHKMPIPFLCIGTDRNWKASTLNKGNLAQAIITSASPITFSN